MKYLTIICLLLANHTFAQKQVYKGKVGDIFKNRLHDVEISLKGSSKYIISDCKGKFEVKGQFGDTLEVKKKGYRNKEIVLDNQKRIKIQLKYDSEYVKSFFELKRKGKASTLGCNCQPLYLVDGLPSSDIDSTDLSPENIRSVDTIKGKDTEPFGKIAASGIIIITTGCRNK